MHPGQGNGLSLHDLGETGGTEAVTLLETEIPAHSHALQADGGDVGEERIPINRALARTTGVGGNLYGAVGSQVSMAFAALPVAGASLPHTNMQPYLTLNFCIALQGIFPPRT